MHVRNAVAAASFTICHGGLDRVGPCAAVLGIHAADPPGFRAATSRMNFEPHRIDRRKQAGR